MKNVLFILFFSLSLNFAYSQEGKIRTAEIKTDIACDHCAVCSSCDQNIYIKVKDNTKGVRKVEIDAEKNIIKVKYNSKRTNLEEIEKAIVLSGFKANQVEPTEEAYNSLDPCCKKK
ncbi:heavy-metal-associated domain-containing protein [Brumimicrobium aurantiacum]|nr:heavy-metal-associated domain-containing protein [Brumimicrobium aurantiacum]